MVVSEVLNQLFLDNPIEEIELPMSLSHTYNQYLQNIENQRSLDRNKIVEVKKIIIEAVKRVEMPKEIQGKLIDYISFFLISLSAKSAFSYQISYVSIAGTVELAISFLNKEKNWNLKMEQLNVVVQNIYQLFYNKDPNEHEKVLTNIF